MASYPAIEVSGLDDEVALAVVDDCRPVAAETNDSGPVRRVTIFFANPSDRDEARRLLLQHVPATSVATRDVEDEGWAARSQAALGPVTVGRLTVSPPWYVQPERPLLSRDGDVHASATPSATVVILPSMGFGTGHHASTRLCLAALQAVDLENRTVLDVGTGSGVLALASIHCGARSAVGLDYDEDALQSARENHALNGAPASVQFQRHDLDEGDLPSADVVVANLTGGLLVRQAQRLMAALRPSGVLIASGLMAAERQAVLSAFEPLAVTWEAVEDEWVGLTLTRPARDR